MAPMLILFDIDGTLLLSQRAGLRAMQTAARELFGDHVSFDGVDFAGRLDPLIWNDVADNHGIDAEAEHDRFRQGYARHLRILFDREASARLLPGVKELIEALRQREAVTLGLLTGNYPETGRMKIETAGLNPDIFPVAAWGCEALSRTDLTPVAMQKYAELHGHAIEADQVIVIGDTIHDVRCATEHGCRSLAVGTGPAYSLEELKASGADLVLEDLSDTNRILGWMLKPTEAITE